MMHLKGADCTIKNVSISAKKETLQQLQQQLSICCGKLLEDDKSLEHYSISRRASIQVELPKSSIFVKTLGGNTITIEVGRNDSVESVKSAIYSREGVPPEQQQLFLCGKQLQNGSTLSIYGIEKDTIPCTCLLASGEV